MRGRQPESQIGTPGYPGHCERARLAEDRPASAFLTEKPPGQGYARSTKRLRTVYKKVTNGLQNRYAVVYRTVMGSSTRGASSIGRKTGSPTGVDRPTQPAGLLSDGQRGSGRMASGAKGATDHPAVTASDGCDGIYTPFRRRGLVVTGRLAKMQPTTDPKG
jgi:hypothetical protein